MSIPYSDNITIINAVTQTTTSDAYDVSKRQQILIEFIGASISGGGSATFTIDGSNDGTNWVTGIAFQDSKATASGTWVTSKAISSNGNEAAYVKSGWRFIRVVCTIAATATGSAIMENGG